MADNAFTDAIRGVAAFRGRCETINADCNAFRGQVAAATARLGAGVAQLPGITQRIADNVHFLRGQIVALKTAAQAAKRGLIS